MKKIIPLKDFIVMNIPKTDSPIALPEGVRVNKESFFVCTAVGEGVKSVKVGDRVIAINQAMMQIKLDETQYHIVKEEFVIGVITETE